MLCILFNVWSNGKAPEDSTVRQLDWITLNECLHFGRLVMKNMYYWHMQVEVQDVPG